MIKINISALTQTGKIKNRIKSVMAGLLLFSICTLGAEAQTVIKGNAEYKAETVQISVQLKGDKTGKDSINVTYWKDHVYGYMLNGSTSIFVKPDKKGKFKINLPAIDHPGRISIWDEAYKLSICHLQLIEPGDNIQINVQAPESDTEEAILKFSGKGAAKYECSKAIAINPMTDYRALYNKANDYHQTLKVADSLLQAKQNVMDQYKDKLSSLAYRIMKADLKGSVYQQTSAMIRPQVNGNNIKTDAFQEQKLRENFRELQTRVDTEDKDALVLSINYPKFLYELAKLEVVLFDNVKSYEFKKIYDKLRNSYSGVLREKLLVYPLFNVFDQYTLFFGINPDVYTNCLKDALELTRTTYLKDALKKRLNTHGKGADALNFTLPADSSGRMVSLSDYKGKVVLVDVWGYICTGCYMFSQTFHEKVYPQFKDNPDFVVVSIMLDEYGFAGKDKYMRRLRGEGKYTSPEYINLYAGEGGPMGLLSNHYNIDCVPFLLLVDKEGKVYSSTPPFFTDKSNSRKIEEFTALIKEALAAKAGM